jgi:hypothetical protein
MRKSSGFGSPRGHETRTPYLVYVAWQTKDHNKSGLCMEAKVGFYLHPCLPFVSDKDVHRRVVTGSGSPRRQTLQDERIHWHCGFRLGMDSAARLSAVHSPPQLLFLNTNHQHRRYRPCCCRRCGATTDTSRNESVSSTSFSGCSHNLSDKTGNLSFLTPSHLCSHCILDCARNGVAATKSLDVSSGACNRFGILLLVDKGGRGISEPSLCARVARILCSDTPMVVLIFLL